MVSFKANCSSRRLAPPRECLGCQNCTGVCREVVELMAIPVIVLKALRKSRSGKGL